MDSLSEGREPRRKNAVTEQFSEIEEKQTLRPTTSEKVNMGQK